MSDINNTNPSDEELNAEKTLARQKLIERYRVYLLEFNRIRQIKFEDRSSGDKAHFWQFGDFIVDRDDYYSLETRLNVKQAYYDDQVENLLSYVTTHVNDGMAEPLEFIYEVGHLHSTLEKTMKSIQELLLAIAKQDNPRWFNTSPTSSI